MIEPTRRIVALTVAGVLGFASAAGLAGCLGGDEKDVTVTTTETGPVPTVASKTTTEKSKPSICDRYPSICQTGNE